MNCARCLRNIVNAPINPLKANFLLIPICQHYGQIGSKCLRAELGARFLRAPSAAFRINYVIVNLLREIKHQSALRLLAVHIGSLNLIKRAFKRARIAAAGGELFALLVLQSAADTDTIGFTKRRVGTYGVIKMCKSRDDN